VLGPRLAECSPWQDVYGQPAAKDLQRITVDGSANATNYVRFIVAGNADDGGRPRRRPLLTSSHVTGPVGRACLLPRSGDA